MPLFHVTSVLNRSSIDRYGLDWTRMGATTGIAGGRRRPERAGCFLCRNEGEVEWFVNVINSIGSVDVWLVEGVTDEDLVESPEGFAFYPDKIARSRLTLAHADLTPTRRDDTTPDSVLWRRVDRP